MSSSYDTLADPKDLRNNKLHASDRAFHDWYRFVLSFPPHLVRRYIELFELDRDSLLLDPFCGTGTTIVEAKKNGIPSIGIEAVPMSHFASKVKTNWQLDPDAVKATAFEVFNCANEIFRQEAKTRRGFSEEQQSIILKNSISELPLHKCLIVLEAIKSMEMQQDVRELLSLALAFVCVYTASNLKFGPEVGVSRKQKADASVFSAWLDKVLLMVSDLRAVKPEDHTASTCWRHDSRSLSDKIGDQIIDAVITSPPYPNEKDYTRTTRLESTLLGFLSSKKDLRELKTMLLRSNTRNVFVADKDDELLPAGGKIDKIAREIERRRIALKKTSGFERNYHRVTRLYFGGMQKHLSDLRHVLKPGGKLAYVVGDQASYLQVLIRTGELLADIAMELGYRVLGIDLFRTRISTTTGDQLREEVLLLEWPKSTGLLVSEHTQKGLDMGKSKNRYDPLIERAFFRNYQKGDDEVSFDREEFEMIAKELELKLPKNLGDIIYSYRYRRELPETITALLAPNQEWIIRSIGKGKYLFAKSAIHRISPNPRLAKIKILDATPEIIRRYALNDEQALLALLRYNRLVDIFLSVTCYSLQNHLRTSVANIGQVETDEIYVAVSKTGKQYVIPVQAKGKTEQLGIVQIEQDFAVCKEKFPVLICRPVAAQFIEEDLIALFEFEMSEGEIAIRDEKHYRVVPNDRLSDDELAAYRK